MAQIYQKEITVLNKKYTIEVCSARDQLTILRMFSRYSLTAVLNALALGSQSLAVGALFGSFTEKATDEEIDQLSEMLIGKMVDEENNLVTVDDFQCNMLAYSELHLKALEVNFGDFSEFLAFHSPSAQEQSRKDDQQ